MTGQATMAAPAGGLDIAIRARRGDFRLEAAFAAPAGSITAIFGASGAGKSTIANAIAGLARPESGHIRLDGTPVYDGARRINLPPERRRVGYVFQDGLLLPHLSVEGNLDYGARRAARADDGRVKVDRAQIIELLGLGGLLRRRPHTLSGGERQRVAIGRALLARPRLLVLDEPLASLDPPRKAQILPLIERLRDDVGLPMVYISHDFREVARLADRLVVLDAGMVRADGPLFDLAQRLDLQAAFGEGDAGVVLQARVAGKDLTHGLSELRCGGNTFRVPALPDPVGTAVRLRVLARDVALAVVEPRGLSVLNQIEATVVDIGAVNDAQVDVLIAANGDAGEVRLIARVTERARHLLGLAPGVRVWALIKAVAVDRMRSGAD